MGIKIYISNNSGNKEIENHQHRITMILKSLAIEFSLVDISAPGMEEERDYMRANGKKKEGQRNVLPPQIFSGDKYCGDFDDFDVANEDDELEEFLGIPRKTPKAEPVKTGATETEVGKLEPGKLENGEAPIKQEKVKASPTEGGEAKQKTDINESTDTDDHASENGLKNEEDRFVVETEVTKNPLLIEQIEIAKGEPIKEVPVDISQVKVAMDNNDNTVTNAGDDICDNNIIDNVDVPKQNSVQDHENCNNNGIADDESLTTTNSKTEEKLFDECTEDAIGKVNDIADDTTKNDTLKLDIGVATLDDYDIPELPKTYMDDGEEVRDLRPGFQDLGNCKRFWKAQQMIGTP